MNDANTAITVNGIDTISALSSDVCHIATVDIDDLYIFMGRELEPLDSVPAGNILGNSD